jgi:hypothetical protein
MLFKRKVFEAGTAASGRLGGARQALHLAASLAFERYGDALRDEQEILMHLADITMEIYAMDSALSRVEKKRLGDPYARIAETFFSDALARVRWSTTQILAAILEGERLRSQLAQLAEWSADTPANAVQNRRQIAEALLDT